MMQEPEIEKDLVRWSRQRWVIWVLFVFILQVGGIFWAAQGEGETKPLQRPATRVAMGNDPYVERLSAMGGDPMIFAAADAKGFSGPGWLESKSWDYDFDGLVKKPEFLHFRQAAVILREPPRQSVIHRVTRAPLFEAKPVEAEVLAPRPVGASKLRIAGGLEERALATPVELPSQRGNDVVGTSVVEAGVNRDGLVISARLTGRSQSKTADQEALRIARRVRFAPVREQEGEMAWGKLIFEWFAVDLVSTNGAPR